MQHVNGVRTRAANPPQRVSVSPPVLVVAALSARLLARSARRAGWRVIALDLFGDSDTREAADAWHPIGDAATLQLDPLRTYAALERASGIAGVIGWIAGSGFEACPQLLQASLPGLPLLGNPPHAFDAVRRPARFFATLAAHGIAFPETRMQAPLETAGWLRKDARGTGGWHIRHAETHLDQFDEPDPDVYFQRHCRGRSMSALFVANGSSAIVLGINEQIVVPERSQSRNQPRSQPRGHPFTWRGAIGPVPVSANLAHKVQHAVQAIVAHSGLVGLNSLDFLVDGERFFVLEVNPRPSATMALYEDETLPPLVALHVRACRGEALGLALQGPRVARVRGSLVVFARTAHTVSPAFVAEAWRRGWCHDIPVAGSAIAAGTPLCSVSVDCPPGSSADTVRAALAARAATIEPMMKVSHDDPLAIR